MLSETDVAYILGGFVSLDELCRQRGQDPGAVRHLIERGALPRPAYVLDDGAEMVPPDYFSLVDAAGGVERLHDFFVAQYTAAAAAENVPLDDPEDEWAAYLSGEYGVCLRDVTPENIVRKSALVQRIGGLLGEPDPSNAAWRDELRATVDELDELERDFAEYDRVRFGGPVSRDLLIAAVRDRYPELFKRPRVGGSAR